MPSKAFKENLPSSVKSASLDTRRLPFLQVKSLAEISWFLSLGTAAQLFALIIVVVKVIMDPLDGAKTELVHTGEAAVSIVAVMNLIFA